MGGARAALVLLCAVVVALPSLRRPSLSDEKQPRPRTTVYIWDKAVWFAPHGHDPAVAPDVWTRRRLGDYENDYEKPDAQDSSKKCFMIAKKIRVNFEIDPLTGDKYGCMSCDPTIGAPTGSCPTTKRCPNRLDVDAEPCDPLDCQTLVEELYAFCSGKEGFLFFVPAQEPKTLPEGYFYDPEDTITGTWNDEVELAVKIAVEKCGCNGSAGSHASVFLAAIIVAAAAWLA
jgi:hypothetical protein